MNIFKLTDLKDAKELFVSIFRARKHLYSAYEERTQFFFVWEDVTNIFAKHMLKTNFVFQ